MITHSQHLYSLMSLQAAVWAQPKLSVHCPKQYSSSFFPLLLHIEIQTLLHRDVGARRCSNLACAEAQTGRAARVTEGDSDSCLELSNENDSNSDLSGNTKSEAEIGQLQRGQYSSRGWQVSFIGSDFWDFKSVKKKQRRDSMKCVCKNGTLSKFSALYKQQPIHHTTSRKEILAHQHSWLDVYIR